MCAQLIITRCIHVCILVNMFVYNLFAKSKHVNSSVNTLGLLQIFLFSELGRHAGSTQKNKAPYFKRRFTILLWLLLITDILTILQ